jgi:hypothetical protein
MEKEKYPIGPAQDEVVWHSQSQVGEAVLFKDTSEIQKQNKQRA